MKPFLVGLVALSRRYALLVALGAAIACVALSHYVIANIRINTDIDELMEADLDWRIQERQMAQAFPQNSDRLVIVIDGANADTAEHAAQTLYEELQKQPELFKTVKRPDAIPFFQTNGLLFLSEKDLGGTLDVLVQAQPMLGGLAQDPSLRGLFRTLSLAAEGILRGQAKYEQIEPSLAIVTQAVRANLNGIHAILPWQSMMSDKAPTIRDLRKYIITQPNLDFTNLSPGHEARRMVRAIADKHHLTAENGVSVRMTGSVALNDEEFASVAEGAELATLASLVLVLTLLFLALKSVRLILPILITLVFGLITTTAFALATVGSLNLISVAFAVMFVGMAVDFGIQFGVRYREERHANDSSDLAMRATAEEVVGPLTLAAGTTILGFLAFIPTDYRGVSELGIIAGSGMVIALFLNLTLLPALLTLFKPPAEPESIAYPWAAPIDQFLNTHRSRLLGLTAILLLISLTLASQVRFDFDPLNLKNPKTESVATLFDIMKDPQATPYTIDILAPTLEDAQTLAAKIQTLPEVHHTITLASFIPENQEEKIAQIEEARFLLEPTLNPPERLISPDLEDLTKELKATADKLRALGAERKIAHELANLLTVIADKNDDTLYHQLDNALVEGMRQHLTRLDKLLKPVPITADTISDDLRRDWIAADGQAKIEVYPKGDGRDPVILAAFTKAVRALAPNATGTPISIQESGRTVMNAFIQAGALGLLAIIILGFVILRKAADVARMIFPLILAVILTLAVMTLINLPLNFANVIALPLLLSLGVSYAIYFITYWKNGNDNLLHSSIARAVLFSAGTTLVAFGSLSLSSHTGTRGMGELLTIALLSSAFSTFLVLPLLLNRKASVKPE